MLASTTLPPRSTNVRSGPFTMMSVMLWSSSSVSSGPSPSDVVHQFAGERALFAAVELDAPFGGDFGDQPFDIRGQPLGRHRGDRRRLQSRKADGAQFGDRLGWHPAGSGRVGVWLREWCGNGPWRQFGDARPPADPASEAW